MFLAVRAETGYVTTFVHVTKPSLFGKAFFVRVRVILTKHQL